MKFICFTGFYGEIGDSFIMVANDELVNHYKLNNLITGKYILVKYIMFKEHFMPLSEWREKQINEILK